MTTFSIVMRYVGIIMALVYVAAGIAVLLQPHGRFIPKQYNLVFGIVLIAYGAFRGYNILKKSS